MNFKFYFVLLFFSFNMIKQSGTNIKNSISDMLNHILKKNFTSILIPKGTFHFMFLESKKHILAYPDSIKFQMNLSALYNVSAMLYSFSKILKRNIEKHLLVQTEKNLQSVNLN